MAARGHPHSARKLEVRFRGRLSMPVSWLRLFKADSPPFRLGRRRCFWISRMADVRRSWILPRSTARQLRSHGRQPPQEEDDRAQQGRRLQRVTDSRLPCGHVPFHCDPDFRQLHEVRGERSALRNGETALPGHEVYDFKDLQVYRGTFLEFERTFFSLDLVRPLACAGGVEEDLLREGDRARLFRAGQEGD